MCFLVIYFPFTELICALSLHLSSGLSHSPLNSLIHLVFLPPPLALALSLFIYPSLLLSPMSLFSLLFLSHNLLSLYLLRRSPCLPLSPSGNWPLRRGKNTHIRVPAHPVTFLSRRASLFPHPDTLGLPLLDPIHLFPSVSPLYLPSLPSTLLTASLESR